MIGRGARTLLARDKPAAVPKLNTWMNGDVELTDVQVELLLAGMGSFRQKLPRPQRLTDDDLRGIAAPRSCLSEPTRSSTTVYVSETAPYASSHT